MPGRSDTCRERPVPSMSSEVDDVELAETLGKLSRQPDQSIYHLADLEALDAWRAEHNSAMRLLPLNRLLGHDNEITNISADQAPPLRRRIPKLLTIRHLIADIEGARGIDPVATKSDGDLRRRSSSR